MRVLLNFLTVFSFVGLLFYGYLLLMGRITGRDKPGLHDPQKPSWACSSGSSSRTWFS